MALPRDEQTIGDAPYAESAAINAARKRGIEGILRRLVSRENLQATAMGLGSISPQARGMDAFFQGVAGGARSRASMDQQRLRNEYAQREEERRLADSMRQPPEKPEKPEQPKKWVPTTYEEWKAAEEYKSSLRPKAGQGGKPAQSPQQKTEATRAKKREKESAMLQHVMDLQDLFAISTDMSLEPETRAAASAKFSRYSNPQNPSQVR
jgi:hypothetical protein